MDAAEIRRRVDSFSAWHYEFDLQGVRTPVSRPEYANRHVQRRRNILDPVVDALGGSLAGRRVLDLGSNAGWWSLASIEAGCDYVLGLDGRRTHVEQAEFVFAASGIPRSRFAFLEADVLRLDFRTLGTFDLVLCLGLLYHVHKPFELLEGVAAVEPDVVLVDTALSTQPGAVLEMRYESVAVPVNALEQPLVLYPTALAVVQLLRSFGWITTILQPSFSDESGCWDYVQGKRRTFVAAAGDDILDMSRLAAESPDFLVGPNPPSRRKEGSS